MSSAFFLLFKHLYDKLCLYLQENAESDRKVGKEWRRINVRNRSVHAHPGGVRWHQHVCFVYLYEKKNWKLWLSHVGKYEVFTFGSFQH